MVVIIIGYGINCMRNLRLQSGFTLVEISIVLLIIAAIISGIILGHVFGCDFKAANGNDGH